MHVKLARQQGDTLTIKILPGGCLSGCVWVTPNSKGVSATVLSICREVRQFVLSKRLDPLIQRGSTTGEWD